MAEQVGLTVEDPRAFVRRYLGIPFLARGRDRNGADCFGLVALIYRDVWGLEVDPAVSDAFWGAAQEDRASIVACERSTGPWVEVPDSEVRIGDVGLFRVLGRGAIHCGLILDTCWMIHAPEGGSVCLEAWRGPMWGRRLEAVYRHRERI